jgi:S1-C subfamily serine protease
MTNLLIGPAVVNLVGIVENDSWAASLVITANGSPLDLTGLTITAKLITSAGAFPIAITVTDAANGEVTISQDDAPLVGVGQWAMRIGSRTYFMGSVTGLKDILS